MEASLVLHHASQFTELNDLVIDLIRSGCNVFYSDMNGDTVVHFCVRGCNFQLLRQIVNEKGPEVLTYVNNSQFNPFLTTCAEASDDRAYEILNILEYMYLQGVSLESQDHQGRTSLLWACQRGSLVVVQWLLSRGANLAHRDHCGRTAMHMAAMHGDEDTILLVAEKGGVNFVNAQSIDDKRVRTPLDICIRRNHYYLALQMKLWNLNRRILGRIVLFRNNYAWYYWLMSLVNVSIACGMIKELLTADTDYWPAALVFLFCWLAQAICWIVAFNANPGFARKNVIPDQTKRCSRNFAQDVNKLPVIKGLKDSATRALHTFERDALSVNLELMDLNRKFRGKRHGGEEEFNNCAHRLNNIRDGVNRLQDRIADERRKRCARDYAALVLDGKSKTVCLTCQMVKPFRVHHCSDCGNCIHRFDHHCIWLDNCIGRGNQRSFWFFLLFTTLGILAFWALFAMFVDVECTVRNADHGLASDLWMLMTRPTFHFGLLGSLLNVMWLTFVSYLLFRTTKSMITNITFYEHLRKPQHIQNRFNGDTYGCFWDMRDLSCVSFFSNIISFCSLDDSNDGSAYLPLQGAPRKTRRPR